MPLSHETNCKVRALHFATHKHPPVRSENLSTDEANNSCPHDHELDWGSRQLTTAKMSVFQSGSKALITGGASGIGLAVAKNCLKHGMRVSIVDASKETLDLAKANLEGDLECFQADISQEQGWKSVKERVGEVDFLMLNAGVMAKGTWGDSDYFQKVRYSLFSMID